MISSSCRAIDDLLGGGVKPNTILEIYGKAGSGKSTIALQFARNCALSGKKVAIIDTDQVSMERLGQICGKDFGGVLNKLIIYAPDSFEEQENSIRKLWKIKGIGLVVVDTINRFYRLELKSDQTKSENSLSYQLTELQLCAKNSSIPVIVTSQIYSKGDTYEPFGGKCIGRFARFIVRVEHGDEPGERVITRIKPVPRIEARLFLTMKGVSDEES